MAESLEVRDTVIRDGQLVKGPLYCDLRNEQVPYSEEWNGEDICPSGKKKAHANTKKG